MSRNGKVVVAMSGGVDSSVAAALLKEQGYDCVGVFMRVGAQAEQTCSTGRAELEPNSSPDAASSGGLRVLPRPARRNRHGCCSADDALDARAIAGRLGIPFYALNFQADFERIIAYFVDEYRQARTPNPCVMCNIQLKFGRLLQYADLVDAQYVATGHYARIVSHGGEPRLARARNAAKDQSYVLFGIGREALPRCLFPLGDFADKALVREVAAQLGLRVHDKPDSQEICFVPDNDYRGLLRSRAPDTLRAGEMRDAGGRRIGLHAGVAHYTIGQRRGLGIATGSPVYVANLDPQANVVTLGPREALLRSGLAAERIVWHAPEPLDQAPRPCTTKIRHMHTAAPGVLSGTTTGDAIVRFDQPQEAVTPGQAAVFYAGDLVLGGGWIRAALPA